MKTLSTEKERLAFEKDMNIKRLNDYKARRQDFVKKYCTTPDNDYAAYYGAEMAQYIDARQWWQHLNEDNQAIKEYEDIEFFKDQAI